MQTPEYLNEDNQVCWQTLGSWSHQPRCASLDSVGHCRFCPVFEQAARDRINARNADARLLTEKLLQRLDDVELGPAVTCGDLSLLPFRIGASWFCLPTASVLTVAASGEVRSLPHRSTEFLRGLVMIDGSVEICVSLAHLLGLEREELASPDFARGVFERLLLVETEGLRFAFRVDEVRESQGAYSEQYQPAQRPPAQMPLLEGEIELYHEPPLLCGLLDGGKLYQAVSRVLV